MEMETLEQQTKSKEESSEEVETMLLMKELGSKSAYDEEKENGIPSVKGLQDETLKMILI